jgi:hypothetical protein
MSCCGNHRTAQRTGNAGLNAPGASYWNAGATSFEYSGPGRLTVTGPLTGTVYRFKTGTSLEVHAQDAPSMVSVPGLKPVR